MKHFFRYAVVFVAFTGLACMFNKKKKNIVFFGDSLTGRGVKTGGYIKIMRKMFDSVGLSAKYNLQGSGIDGNKVHDLFVRMDDDVVAKDPCLVFIWIGVNDVWHKLSGTGTDADKFEEYYRAIIKRFRTQKIKVILVTPAVIGEKPDGTNQQDDDLTLYSNIVRKLSNEYNCKLVDLRKAFFEFDKKNNMEQKRSGILTVDGVHLSTIGNRFVAEKMMEVLVPFLKSSN
ncbi:MAG: GDSL-type esterase/lipase family protein [Bacteroidota bacterium]|nr:GDSL-type esterase/lipase family protein [Bacteroidota bacterium]